MLPMKDMEQWIIQINQLVKLGFPKELGIAGKEYRAGMPAFQPQPIEFKGRFRLSLLIDPRVSLVTQLRLHEAHLGVGITEAVVVRLALKESQRPDIPREPYQIWITPGSTKRCISDFSEDERGLTSIEGLAFFRESPQSFRFKVTKSNPEAYLMGSKGQRMVLVNCEQTICAGSFWENMVVVAISRCKYVGRGEQIEIEKRIWDVNDKNGHSVLPSAGILPGRGNLLSVV